MRFKLRSHCSCHRWWLLLYCLAWYLLLNSRSQFTSTIHLLCFAVVSSCNTFYRFASTERSLAYTVYGELFAFFIACFDESVEPFSPQLTVNNFIGIIRSPYSGDFSILALFWCEYQFKFAWPLLLLVKKTEFTSIYILRFAQLLDWSISAFR